MSDVVRTLYGRPGTDVEAAMLRLHDKVRELRDADTSHDQVYYFAPVAEDVLDDTAVRSFVHQMLREQAASTAADAGRRLTGEPRFHQWTDDESGASYMLVISDTEAWNPRPSPAGEADDEVTLAGFPLQAVEEAKRRIRLYVEALNERDRRWDWRP